MPRVHKVRNARESWIELDILLQIEQNILNYMETLLRDIMVSLENADPEPQSFKKFEDVHS